MAIRNLKIENQTVVNGPCVVRNMTLEERRALGSQHRGFSTYDESIDFLAKNAYKTMKKRRAR